MLRCRWFRPKPLTSFWLNVERAARQLRITVSCLLLSLRASNRRIKRGFSLGGWSTARGTSELDSGGVETKRSPRQRDARQATPTLYFTARRSWILQPIWASSSPAPVTCIHPASCRASLALLSGLPWPWKRHMETSSVQKTSVGNVVPCRLRLAARVAQTRSHFQRLRDGGRCTEMITSPI